MKKLSTPWAMEPVTLEHELESDIMKGLSASTADNRLNETGKNKITQSKSLTFGDILLEEVKEPLILMLLAIGVLYSIWGDIGDTIMIICVILTVSLVEVYTEYKAKKSIESLKTLALPTTWVLRDGKPAEIETSFVVPGDILILKSGVKISADARILESFGLEANESQLTGESMSITKNAELSNTETGLNDRSNMVHMGSVILKGNGKAIVVATGMDTELGKIAGLTEESREPKTPLQKSMKQLSGNLIWAAIFFSILVPVLGLLRGLPFKEMILTGLSFAFAIIPEEMPIIITMVLGLGAIKLSKKNILIKRTKAAETLGSVTVIATDKTGTLTENKMRIEHYSAKNESLLFTLSSLMADVIYDNDSDESSVGSFLGDPMDKSIVDKAAQLGIDRRDLLKEYKCIKDYGFDEDKKIFESVFQYKDKMISIIKGAPETVFSISKHDDEMEKQLKEALSIGLRTIAVACKEESQDLYILTGFLCFDDPVREGVKEAISDCTGAGIRVIMITGDHAATAQRVAKHAGIQVTGVLTGEELSKLPTEKLNTAVNDCNLFARISPEQKLNIVTALRENGEIIAVTGDGINDAPALKAADIGISMGIAGSDVAKETADMILTNDSFTSIVTAVEEGRRLFDNLSKCVKYYLACKAGLILAFLIPILLNLPLPFSPIQIIILELFMDLAASTSFVAEDAESDVLKRKPRNPQKNFMDKSMIMGIFSGGITLAATVLAVYLYSLFGGSTAEAQTFAFVTWLFTHVCLAFNMRTRHVPLTKAGVFGSRAFNIWMGGVAIFLLLALNVPVLREYLNLASIGIAPLLCLALIAVAATSWLEIRKIRRL